ncbi:helix-turn-helix domain-containing protein [Ectothiorhodospiraceae bacterium WFHF3C12]|nr:helix-turn-helix domain-containing protein [Ectothiorhodospiraceae bacterium WFHF3C12]
MERVAARNDLRTHPRAAERVPMLNCMGLIHEMVRHAGDPLLELRGFHLLHRTGRLLPQFPRPAGGTPEEILRHLQRYLCVDSELGDLSVSRRTDSFRVRLDPRPEFVDNRPQIETHLYSLIALLSRNPSVRWRAVDLKINPTEAYRSEYKRLYGLTVRFGQQADAVTFTMPTPVRPVPARRSTVAGVGRLECRLRRLQPTLPWTDSAGHLLPMVLPFSDPPLQACASLLAVSPRTLQRRIEAEGMTFRTLLHETRKKLASRMLGHGCPTTELAHQLGYSHTGQFYRAPSGAGSGTPRSASAALGNSGGARGRDRTVRWTSTSNGTTSPKASA